MNMNRNGLKGKEGREGKTITGLIRLIKVIWNCAESDRMKIGGGRRGRRGECKCKCHRSNQFELSRVKNPMHLLVSANVQDYLLVCQQAADMEMICKFRPAELERFSHLMAKCVTSP